jgi:hypothetical protein
MVEMAREAWTDERLGDLNRKVEEGFTDTRTEFRSQREEMRTGFRAVGQELVGVREEIGALNRTIHQFTFALVGTVFLGFMGTITAIATQT